MIYINISILLLYGYLFSLYAVNGYIIWKIVIVALLSVFMSDIILKRNTSPFFHAWAYTICIIFLINSIQIGCIRDTEDNGFFRFRWGRNSSFAGLLIFMYLPNFFLLGKVPMGILLVIWFLYVRNNFIII